MTIPRFLQIHTLHSYSAALLNRDDSGLAKRIPYGGAMRTRISSQCLKRHWRTADHDPHSLHKIDGAELAHRSRDLIDSDHSHGLLARLNGTYSDDVTKALRQWFNWAIYSGNNAKKPKKLGQEVPSDNKKSRQTLLFGEPEMRWLASEFETLAKEAGGDAEKAFKLGEDWADGGKDSDGQKKKDFKDNIKALRENTELTRGQAGGLTAALFGRMVTSDPAANIEAPLHVAHAFTVHAEEAEGDYFVAVDDLKDDAEDSGADTIQETELTSGLYYGYVVIDLPGLIANCGKDRSLVSRVVHNLAYLIAEVSPGAKLGSTAPYGRAGLMLIEAGDRQPRSLAGAFRTPCKSKYSLATETLNTHLTQLDTTYETGEIRRYLSLEGDPIQSAEKTSLKGLAEWAAQQAGEAPDE